MMIPVYMSVRILCIYIYSLIISYVASPKWKWGGLLTQRAVGAPGYVNVNFVSTTF